MGNARSGHVDFGEMAGMPPRAYEGGIYTEDTIASQFISKSNSQTFVKPGPHAKDLRTVANRNLSGFNLRGVAEVLSEAGLDPTVELVRVLRERQVVTDRSGNPILDKDGNPVTEPIIDNVLRTKVLMELQQFVAPKLKAVEVTVKEPELTEEQIDARIAALQAKANVNG